MSTRALVITCVGPDRPGLVGALTGVIAQGGGNIQDSRMALLGGEFAIIMLVDVAADRHSDLQAGLETHAEAAGLVIGVRDTRRPAASAPGRSYRVRADTMDHPGIVQQIAAFFASQQCNIAELETSTWAAPHTGTTMFTLDMQVTVPATLASRVLREAFDQFCLDTDLDASLEPVGR
ncbi:MAG: glycine cleavage system protein R [Gammaproteobacteria bacterium]|nr:glycine cleavage system protein R [Gammaproteobacteria bacterium]